MQRILHVRKRRDGQTVERAERVTRSQTSPSSRTARCNRFDSVSLLSLKFDSDALWRRIDPDVVFLPPVRVQQQFVPKIVDLVTVDAGPLFIPPRSGKLFDSLLPLRNPLGFRIWMAPKGIQRPPHGVGETGYGETLVSRPFVSTAVTAINVPARVSEKRRPG